MKSASRVIERRNSFTARSNRVKASKKRIAEMSCKLTSRELRVAVCQEVLPCLLSFSLVPGVLIEGFPNVATC
jgi:hypothetical protein